MVPKRKGRSSIAKNQYQVRVRRRWTVGALASAFGWRPLRREAKLRDPLAKLQALLADEGLLSDERDGELHDAARNEVDAATKAAEAAPFPPDDDVFERVFEEAR